MRILKRFIGLMIGKYATCPCDNCSEQSMLKSEMVNRELKWFCSDEAYLEYKARCQDWLT